MHKYAIRWLCAVALVVSAGSARATFHLWQLNEIYSNSDGTVQFIELITGSSDQQFLSGYTITSSQGTTTQVFAFPSDLPGNTFTKTFLIGTTGFAALGLVTPDYIVPNGFLFTTNGSVNFAGVGSVSWIALPVDGVNSIDRFGGTATNSPKNFAGQTATISAGTAPVSPSPTVPGGVMTLFGTRGTVTPTTPMYGSFALVNPSVIYIAVLGPTLGILGYTNNPLNLPNVRVYDASGKDVLQNASGGVTVSGCASSATVAIYYATIRGGALNANDTCVSKTLAAGVYTFTINPNNSSSSGELLFEVTVNP